MLQEPLTLPLPETGFASDGSAFLAGLLIARAGLVDVWRIGCPFCSGEKFHDIRTLAKQRAAIGRLPCFSGRIFVYPGGERIWPLEAFWRDRPTDSVRWSVGLLPTSPAPVEKPAVELQPMQQKRFSF